MTDQIDMISHFDFLAMISLFQLSFLLFILRLSSGTKFWHNFKKLMYFFTVLLLLQVHLNYLDIRFFSSILIGVSFSSNLFHFYVPFLSVHLYIDDCFTINERCFKPV